MKLSDVNVKDVAWNITPQRNPGTWKHYLGAGSGGNEEVINAIKRVSYFETNTDRRGRTGLMLHTEGRDEAIENCEEAGITRENLMKKQKETGEKVYPGHYPHFKTILGLLIDHYQLGREQAPSRDETERSANADALSALRSCGWNGSNKTDACLETLGFSRMIHNRSQVFYTKKIDDGCLLAFGIRSWSGRIEHCDDVDYFYFVEERDRDYDIRCIMDQNDFLKVVEHNSLGAALHEENLVCGPLKEEGTAGDLALILLKVASMIDKRFGRYVAFLDL